MKSKSGQRITDKPVRYQILYFVVALFLLVILCRLCFAVYSNYPSSESKNVISQPIRSPTRIQSEKIASCSRIRFGEYLGPDDVDDLINEGYSFSNVSEVQARFNCENVPSLKIEWLRNNEPHCTYSNNTGQCDQSWITTWDSLPGEVLVTLFSKDGYSGNLTPGNYKLILLSKGKELQTGTFTVGQ